MTADPVETINRLLRRSLAVHAPRVVNGVDLLNHKVPGWYKPNNIGLKDLDLAHGRQCVLGQLAVHGAMRRAGYVTVDERADQVEFEEALDALGIDSCHHGFTLDWSVIEDVVCRSADDREVVSMNDHGVGYGTLNELWTEAIRMTRRGETVTAEALIDRAGGQFS